MPSLIWKLRINNSKLKTKANTCPVCKKVFPTPANLKCHLRVHTLEKPFECGQCGKCFNQIYNLQRHELLHSGQKPHSCKDCGKSFRLKTHLKIHRFTHTGESRHQCEVCNKKFGQSSALKYHQFIHTGERPHMCDVCGKSFNQQASLSMHKAIHGDVKYNCEECGKSFRYRSNLLEHKRSKHEGNFFSCEVCDKKFSYKSNLKKHMDLHSEVKKSKEYQCFDCNKIFSQKANLSNHVANIHLQTNATECAICNRCFTNKYSLERHLIRFHMTDKRKKYSCNLCYKSFKFLTSLKRHKVSYCFKNTAKKAKPEPKSEEPSPDKNECETEPVDETNVEILKPEECTEISYECDVCQQILDSPESLDVHLISHTEKEIKIAESKKRLLTSPKNKDTIKVKLPTPTKKVGENDHCQNNDKEIKESAKKSDVSSGRAVNNDTPKSPGKKNKSVASPIGNNTPKSRKRNRLTPSKYSTIVNSTLIEDEEEQDEEQPDKAQQKEIKYECCICNLKLETLDDLKKHLFSHAKKGKKTPPPIVKRTPETPPVKINKCKICNKNFESVDALKMHFFTHGKEEMFALLCGIDGTPNKNDTPMGVAQKKKNVSFKMTGDDDDSNSVVTKNSVIQTGKSTPPTGSYSCGMCNANFTTVYSRKRHEKSYCTKSPIKTLTCILCKQDFPECDLEKHQKTCHKTAPNEIDTPETKPKKFKKHVCECGRKFPTEFSLRKHRKRFCSLNTEKPREPEQETPLDLTKQQPSEVREGSPKTAAEEVQNHQQAQAADNSEKPRRNSRKNYKVNRIVRKI